MGLLYLLPDTHKADRITAFLQSEGRGPFHGRITKLLFISRKFRRQISNCDHSVGSGIALRKPAVSSEQRHFRGFDTRGLRHPRLRRQFAAVYRVALSSVRNGNRYCRKQAVASDLLWEGLLSILRRVFGFCCIRQFRMARQTASAFRQSDRMCATSGLLVSTNLRKR